VSVERIAVDCQTGVRRWLSGATVRQFLSFLVVGGVGLVVDAGVFWIAHEHAHWTIFWSRVLSVIVAITTTWLLNRAITFRRYASAERAAEYIRYVISQALGLTVNLAVFTAALLLVPRLQEIPIVALLLGSAVALFVNFIAAKLFAFRARRR
jgi:putative flippase GtrA